MAVFLVQIIYVLRITAHFPLSCKQTWEMGWNKLREVPCYRRFENKREERNWKSVFIPTYLGFKFPPINGDNYPVVLLLNGYYNSKMYWGLHTSVRPSYLDWFSIWKFRAVVSAFYLYCSLACFLSLLWTINLSHWRWKVFYR